MRKEFGFFSWIFLIFWFIGDGTGSERLLVEQPENTTVLAETKAIFICRARSQVPPVVTWKINGKHVNRSRFIITSGIGLLNGTSTLTIHPVRNQDNNSVITCIANSGGVLSDTDSARLTVLDAENVLNGYPAFKEPSTSVRAVEKAYPTTISCLATGHPKPDITWLKDSLPLDIRGARYNVTAAGLLHIRSVEESDEGVYGCIARNAKGTTYSKALTLYVKTRRVPPQFFIRPNSTYSSVPVGGSLELTCAAVGHPVPGVKWERNSDEDSGSDAIVGLNEEAVGRKTIKLDNLTKSIRLTCFAESNLGRIQVSTTVNVGASHGSSNRDFTVSENHKR